MSKGNPYLEEWRNRYYKKTKTKGVLFNTEADEELLAFADRINFSGEVKRLLHKERTRLIKKGEYTDDEGFKE